MTDIPQGFNEFLKQSLIDTIFTRRTRRVSRGKKIIRAGSLTFENEAAKPRPLTELEEALLIAVTGVTGVTIPDRPFRDDNDTENIMGAPNLHMTGRSAGSPDNAQATHFFLINDSGTFYLEHLNDNGDLSFTPENLILRAKKSKKRILDKRLDFVNRDFPVYLDSNRFLSNIEGTTLLLPVVDLTRQYINALMYILTQPDGSRPVFLDDRNFHRYAGIKKWVRNGFLNKDIPLTLGALGKMRTEYEAILLLQNLMLTAHGMGLGAWIHATISPPVMLGHPYFKERVEHNGLGFDYHKPNLSLFSPATWWSSLLDIFRWGSPFPIHRSHPVGLPSCFQGLCPPYCEDMRAAVQEIVDHKFTSPDGIYTCVETFKRTFKEGLAQKYVDEVPSYNEDVIECAKDICEYIYKTHRRFPAHCDAVDIPGVWLQSHSLNIEYYDQLFRDPLTEAQRNHDNWWSI